MITLQHYFGGKPHTDEQADIARDLLAVVNALLTHAKGDGIVLHIDPDTGTHISGSKGGAGDGGFRLPTATTGRGKSSHKEAMGIDVFDPADTLDGWLTKFDTDGGAGNAMLAQYGLYREAPGATLGWCHLTIRMPGSGRRTFFP